MQKKNKIFDVIIIGGGASGMMTAAVSSSRGLSVLLVDKNKRLGEKLRITGGGRCNITNKEEDIHKLLKVYGKGEPFLYSPFSVFGVKDTFKYFESRGLSLVTEARNRVFPVTQNANDVANILIKELNKNNVSIISECVVKDIVKTGDKISKIITNQGEFKAKSYVLSTGGMSHPETGSTGDGFIFLKDLGHTVSSPTPDIVPITVLDSWVKNLSGTSLSFMKISFSLDGQKQFSKLGKILFTHFGLSGPLILNSAKKIKELLEKGVVTANIDMYPDTNNKLLEERIIKVFDDNKNKNLKSIIKEFSPEGMSKAVESLMTFISLDTKVHSITKENRKEIVKLLKAMPLTILGTMGYERSVVVDGGVDLKEIDMKTMKSKIVPNLFITGDLLHINRNSGGYSLQICWTTGYISGMNV